MLNIIEYILFISLLICISCDSKRKDFISKEIQETGQRTVKGSLTAIDSVNLSKFNLYDASSIKMNKTHVFVKDTEDFKIVAIQKNDFDSHYTIDLQEGKGPREILQIQSFDVKDSTMVILDENQSKVLIFELPDIFKKEFTLEKVMPHRIRILNSKSFILFTPMVGSEFLFNRMNIHSESFSFFENVPSQHNPMVYEGFINTQDDNFYYAGYSEPMLKKYSSDGEIIYSVATIDNFDTEANYLESDDGAIMGYTPGALFSTSEFDIYQDYWLVLPYNNDDLSPTYLDIYDEKSGQYIGTVEGLKSGTTSLQIDNSYIYAISTNGKKFTLTRYKNDISFI